MENRTARQILFLAAMVATPYFARGQELAPAARFVDPASMQVQRQTPAQLADLVAPIALYPDSLLSQVLVASTYPLDVVQAQQWLDRNGHLQGQELMDAARQQPWDASVQGLVAFPDALATLNEDVQWTTALGNAFLAQEADVMEAVQDLRARAQAAGRLSSNPQQVVSAVAEEGRTVIEIVPADPQVIYVPVYDPYYVWGAPAWGAYPPLSYRYGYGYGPAVNVGFWFGGWSWGWGWGWGPNWYGGSIWVNNAFFRHCGYKYGRHDAYHGGHHGRHKGGHDGGYGKGSSGGRETWKHDPGNRKGVPYSTARGAGSGRGGSQASRSTLTGPGPSRRAGSLATSPTGGRAMSPGSRSTGRDEGWRSRGGAVSSGPRVGTGQDARAGADQGWRSGGGAVAPRTRGEGADRGWSSTSTQGRRPPTTSPGQRSSSGYSGSASRSPSSPPRSLSTSPRRMATSPRDAASPPRSLGSSSRSPSSSHGYSAPTRSHAPSAPSRGFQTAPRGPSPSGSGRSVGGGGSQRSAAGGASRGSSGSRGPSGGSGGGGRRH